MNPATTIRERVDDFLAQRTLAVVGVSRTKSDFSRQLVALLRHLGFAVYAVNPYAEQLDGETCYHRVADIPAPVDGALLMVSQALLGPVLQECVLAGVPRLWIYGVGHPKKLDLRSQALCDERHVSVINGLCPRMFLRDSAWPHRLHGWIATRGRAFRTSAA